MVLEAMTERQRELRLNRTIYWLRQGIPPEQLDASRIDVAPEELPDLIDVARRRIIENDKAYADMTRRSALGYMAFGAAILGIALFLSQGDVPLLRQGRLLLFFAIGGASLAWGLFRYFNHNPDYHF